MEKETKMDATTSSTRSSGTVPSCSDNESSASVGSWKQNFSVLWAKKDDEQVKTTYQQTDKTAAKEIFLQLAERRRTPQALARSDSVWDSVDEALLKKAHDKLPTTTPEDMFRPSDFRLQTKLGQGGYGCVYKALHLPSGGHVVALKELTGNTSTVETLDHRTLPWDCGVVPCYGTFRAFSMHFSEQDDEDDHDDHDKITAITTKETAALAKDTSKLKTWLILQYCPQGSLVDRILSDKGVLSEKEAGRMLKRLVKTLVYLKEHHGIVHNDIKPANLIYSDEDDGTLLLCDFGAAQKGLWRTDRIGGTYSYMPPEKLRARKLVGFLTHYCNHEKHDVWALGVSLFVSLYCKHPFNCKDLAKCTTITSSGQDAAKFYDLMETNYDTIQYPPTAPACSDELKDLLQGMLTPYCLERMSLESIKEHAWVRRGGKSRHSLLQTLKTALRSRRNSTHITEDQAFAKVLWQSTASLEEETTANSSSGTRQDSPRTRQAFSRQLSSSVEGTC
ncbi:activated protein kinase kinase 1 [Seminavis robusta]|uniref:Activated protein kinase kinase 1 n=1 Tax=Seminavis robusta TaxID=568900 RepID=A0A9N8DEM6_9STRA|nr:activated protein kinase kinase 1 [Seminavis robusta]|eukprot:Sro87_g045910.1 activated protein kinase kinase 1 (505) ;mRNA; r:3477-5063